MELHTMKTEIVGSYYNKTAEQVKVFLNQLPEYTYGYQFKELLSVFEADSIDGIIVVFLDLSNKTNCPISLYQIISIARELEQLNK